MSKWPSIKHFANITQVCILGMVAGVLLLCQGILITGTASASSVEYRVKNRVSLQLYQFIEWPAAEGGGKTQPFQIGILGEDPFGKELEGLAGKTVEDRTLTVQHYPIWDDRAAKCDILFISGSQEKDLAEIIRRLDGSSVLTVGDTDAYASRGVMINFFMEDNKVRFRINLKQAKQAGFKISSRLLKLAVILEDSGG